MNGFKGLRVDAICDPNTKYSKQADSPCANEILCHSTGVVHCHPGFSAFLYMHHPYTHLSNQPIPVGSEGTHTQNMFLGLILRKF